MYPCAWTDRLHDSFTDLGLALFGGVGHFPHSRAPARTSDAIASFFVRVFAGPPRCDGRPVTFGPICTSRHKLDALMPTEAAPLFTPFTLGGMEIKNRVVMAPLTRSRSSEAGIVPDYAATYYAQRADAGLIVSEATNISAQGRGYAKTPGIWTAEQVEAWRLVTAAVHARGGRMVLQLWHTGRISHPDLHGGAPAGGALRSEARGPGLHQ